MSAQELILTILVIAIAIGVFYMLDPTFGGLLRASREGFESSLSETVNQMMPESGPPSIGGQQPIQFHNTGSVDQAEVFHAPANKSEEEETKTENFENMNPSPMPFAAAEKPANCYPKNQLAPQELLPNDPNSKWAQVNPMGTGDIAGKNFLNAGSLIGVNTVGQSLRNASWDLRSEPPNPQVQVSPWMQSTIEPELQRRPLEIA